MSTKDLRKPSYINFNQKSLNEDYVKRRTSYKKDLKLRQDQLRLNGSVQYEYKIRKNFGFLSTHTRQVMFDFEELSVIYPDVKGNYLPHEVSSVVSTMATDELGGLQLVLRKETEEKDVTREKTWVFQPPEHLESFLDHVGTMTAVGLPLKAVFNQLDIGQKGYLTAQDLEEGLQKYCQNLPEAITSGEAMLSECDTTNQGIDKVRFSDVYAIMSVGTSEDPLAREVLSSPIELLLKWSGFVDARLNANCMFREEPEDDNSVDYSDQRLVSTDLDNDYQKFLNGGRIRKGSFGDSKKMLNADDVDIIDEGGKVPPLLGDLKLASANTDTSKSDIRLDVVEKMLIAGEIVLANLNNVIFTTGCPSIEMDDFSLSRGGITITNYRVIMYETQRRVEKKIKHAHVGKPAPPTKIIIPLCSIARVDLESNHVYEMVLVCKDLRVVRLGFMETEQDNLPAFFKGIMESFAYPSKITEIFAFKSPNILHPGLTETTAEQRKEIFQSFDIKVRHLSMSNTDSIGSAVYGTHSSATGGVDSACSSPMTSPRSPRTSPLPSPNSIARPINRANRGRTLSYSEEPFDTGDPDMRISALNELEDGGSERQSARTSDKDSVPILGGRQKNSRKETTETSLKKSAGKARERSPSNQALYSGPKSNPLRNRGASIDQNGLQVRSSKGTMAGESGDRSTSPLRKLFVETVSEAEEEAEAEAGGEAEDTIDYNDTFQRNTARKFTVSPSHIKNRNPSQGGEEDLIFRDRDSCIAPPLDPFADYKATKMIKTDLKTIKTDLYTTKENVNALPQPANYARPPVDGWELFSPVKEYARQGIMFELETTYCDDYERGSNASSFRPWRLWSDNFTMTETYPSAFVVPGTLNDREILEAAKFRSKCRLPALTWLERDTGACLVRSSQPMTGFSSNRNVADKVLLDLYRIKGNPHSLKEQRNPSTFYVIDCRSHLAANANAAFGKGVENMKHLNNTKILFCGIPNIHTMRSSLEHLHRVLIPWIPAKGSHGGKGIAASLLSKVKQALVGDEKNAMDTLRDLHDQESGSKVVDGADPTDAKAAGSTGTAFEEAKYFLWRVEETGWLEHTRTVIGSSIMVAEKLSIEGCSVLVHCSDGWDRTAQVCSTAQLILDPYYRTLEGICVLIEKDWCSFGHKFHDRSGHAKRNDGEGSKEISPIFVQWLDVVSQFIYQFPNQFEFNEDFLVFVADSLHSCLFGTFLGNSERERKDVLKADVLTNSIWTYVFQKEIIDKFANKDFMPTERALWPSVRQVRLWDRYWCRWDLDMHPRMYTGRKWADNWP